MGRPRTTSRGGCTATALELDPAFARAYAGLALTHAFDYRNQWTARGAQALARAFELAQTALQIDPDIPELYWVLAFVHAEQRHHEQALKELRRAIRLDRSFADAYALMGRIYANLGQPDRTIPLLRTAMRLNPEAGYLYFQTLGQAYFFLGDAEQALVNLREAVSRNPVSVENHLYLAAALALARDLESAKWEAEEIRSLEPNFSARKWLETHPMTDSGQRSSLIRMLAQLGL